MEDSAWILCLLLVLMRITDTNCHSVMKRSSSGGAGVAPQTCGTNNTNFYCPYDPNRSARCKPRSQRCNGRNICNKPDTMKEEGCSETSNPGEYYVLLGHANLSRKKRSTFEHRFVTFRGFTYEFGKSYGVQVLDIGDPIYKYKNGQHLNRDGIERIGRSYCNWEDANVVVEMWKSKEYNLFERNCHAYLFMALAIDLQLHKLNVRIIMLSFPSILIDSCRIALWYVATMFRLPQH